MLRYTEISIGRMGFIGIIGIMGNASPAYYAH